MFVTYRKTHFAVTQAIAGCQAGYSIYIIGPTTAFIGSATPRWASAHGAYAQHEDQTLE